jgi:hypothetical protein
MKTEIKRSDFPDTPDGQHSYEMKVYTEEQATKHNDAMLLEQLDIILNSLDLKKDKK